LKDMPLINARTNEVVAASVEVASTRAARRRGLLGRDRLDPSAAMLLAPCPAVHTAFMRFAIDVAFLDADGRVVKLVRNMAPWRVAASWRARAVAEVAAGGLDGVNVGDQLRVVPLETVH
jgi:uncharacterized membrane protein (UPF0127 family)